MSVRPSAPGLARFAEFAAYARAVGVPVGIEAELDLGRALHLLPLLDRASVRSACLATWAKSPEAVERLGRAFDAFWSSGDALPPTPWPSGEEVVLRPRRRPPRTGGRTRRSGAPEPEERISVPIGTWSAHAPGGGHPVEPLTDPEVRALRHGARRFRRTVATLPGRRSSRARRGEVDLRATLRRALGHGGELTELRHRAPAPRRAELVIFWDVSGSMREHESGLFALVHALETTSRSARVFAFSTHVVEITPEVRRDGYLRAAERVGSRIDRADGGTQIAASLHELGERFERALGDRTTLVIVSDGWDLGDRDALGPELERIRRRVHAIVWLNPYARRPGFEPRVAALASALPYLDRLLGPEDFASRRPGRRGPGAPVAAQS